MFPFVSCPVCKTSQQGPFPKAGCACGFSLSGLAGLGSSVFQTRKDPQHRDIIYGRGIQLYGKPINTSFDYYGEANIVDIVDFALTYGERRKTKSLHGNHDTEVIVAYIPDIIGSGITKWSSSTPNPCSGICLMSPESTGGYEHSYAVLDDWVSAKFSGDSSVCRFCPKTTPFGLGICIHCFARNGNDWRNFIDPNYTVKT